VNCLFGEDIVDVVNGYRLGLHFYSFSFIDSLSLGIFVIYFSYNSLFDLNFFFFDIFFSLTLCCFCSFKLDFQFISKNSVFLMNHLASVIFILSYKGNVILIVFQIFIIFASITMILTIHDEFSITLSIVDLHFYVSGAFSVIWTIPIDPLSF
jgi:hypothetical protein